MKDRAIGIYDSGYGGLTVLKEVLKLAPNGNYIYFGDNKRIPYGDKTKEELIEISKEVIKFFEEKDVKAIVLACNTISAQALDELEKFTDISLIGIGHMGAKGVIRETENKKVLVLATKSTVESGLYNKCVNELDAEIEVRGIGCSKLVPIIESEEVNEKRAKILEALREYKLEVDNFSYDTIVLGCTHYPYVKKEIMEVFGVDKKIVNPSLEQARAVIEQFPEELDRSSGSLEFFTTGDVKAFNEFASNYLDKLNLKIHKFNF